MEVRMLKKVSERVTRIEIEYCDDEISHLPKETIKTFSRLIETINMFAKRVNDDRN